MLLIDSIIAHGGSGSRVPRGGQQTLDHEGTSRAAATGASWSGSQRATRAVSVLFVQRDEPRPRRSVSWGGGAPAGLAHAPSKRENARDETAGSQSGRGRLSRFRRDSCRNRRSALLVRRQPKKITHGRQRRLTPTGDPLLDLLLKNSVILRSLGFR